MPLGLEDGMAELVRGSKWQDYTSSEHGIINLSFFPLFVIVECLQEL